MHQLAHAILDLDADKRGIQGPVHYVTVAPLEDDWLEESLEDTVYGTFREVKGPRTVGHAVVHWWLFEDAKLNDLLAKATDPNAIDSLKHMIDAGYVNTQDIIDALMDHIKSQDGALDDDHWAAHGKYNSKELADMIGDSTDKQPFDVIDYWAALLHADTNIFGWQNPIGDPWHTQTVTADGSLMEDRGVTKATMKYNAGELTKRGLEAVMIVVLVYYPGGDDPTKDHFNGESIVIIEKGKKQFLKAKIT